MPSKTPKQQRLMGAELHRRRTGKKPALPSMTTSEVEDYAHRPKGGYSKTKFIASFVGFAPAKHPKLLVAVMVDEPKGDIYGGTVAGPAFRDITNYARTNLRIAPE